MAKAVLMPDGADETAYRQLGSAYEGRLLSLKVSVPGVGVGYRYASAIYFNSEYALTAAHNVYDLLFANPTYDIGTGPNYWTNRGTIVPVESVFLYPGFSGNNGSYYSPDIAIVHFAEPLPGVPATIGSVSPLEVLTAVGFGQVGTPSTGLASPRDGNSRGWRAAVDDYFIPPYLDPKYYFTTDFGDYCSGCGVSPPPPPLNGKGAPGDSGGPWYDSTGNLVGISIAVRLPYDSTPPSQTHSLRLSQPEVYSWIVANTVVPEPSTLLLFASGGIGILLRFRHRRYCR